MGNELLCFVMTILFVAALVIFCWGMCGIGNIIYKFRDKKHRKEHPEYFRLYGDYSEKADIACRWHNRELAPRKRKVKHMLEDEPYWPQQVREQKMEELEKLRREIYTAECMCKTLDKDTQEARAKVADYVRAHNIKWAGDWD